MVSAFVEALVWKRARRCCEYCRLPSAYSRQHFEIDHIRARKHRGKTLPDNLALACFLCNNAKGSDQSGYDPQSDTLVRLFHPRNDKWAEHFQWHGPVLIGLTDVGRATIALLDINETIRVAQRQLLIECGVFPPND